MCLLHSYDPAVEMEVFDNHVVLVESLAEVLVFGVEEFEQFCVVCGLLGLEELGLVSL